MMNNIFQKKYVVRWLPVALVVLGATLSFVYGWYFDDSKPQSGAGWSDQRSYAGAADQLASGQLPTRNQLHYAVGYPILGAIGHVFSATDPFMVVSLVLLLASVLLCFYAVKHLFGVIWALIFSASLFAWDGVARSFNFASELFVVPWNNQVLFFAFAFFFWLLVTRSKKQPSYKLVSLAAFVVGFTFLTREESPLFLFPMLAAWLFITKTNWRKYILAFGIALVCFVPQIIIKTEVLGSVNKTGRASSYAELSSKYLQPSLFARNIVETVIDSSQFGRIEANRPALLQQSPWLWLSFIGFVLILARSKYPLGLKLFIIASIGLLIFYLAGINMSAHKLQYHCLRYITPGFIGLYLALIVVLREAWPHVKNLSGITSRTKLEQKKS